MKTEKYWSDSLVSLEILGLTKSMNGWSAKPPEKKFRWLKMRKMWCMVLVQDEPGIAAGFSHSFLQLGASTKDFAEAMRKIEIALRNAELQKKVITQINMGLRCMTWLRENFHLQLDTNPRV